MRFTPRQIVFYPTFRRSSHRSHDETACAFCIGYPDPARAEATPPPLDTRGIGDVDRPRLTMDPQRGATLRSEYRRNATGCGRHCLEIAGDLRQEPGPALGLIDPVLDHAGRGDVVVPVANFVRGPQ